MVQLVVTYSIVKPVSFFVMNLKGILVDKMILKKEDYKTEFDESDEITDILYFMLVLLFTTILFPYLTLV
jgi:hypothetical protein